MVDVTITIPDDKVNELRAGFLYAEPIPVDKNDNPLYTALQWFRIWIRRQVFKHYKTGKINMAKDSTTPVIDEEILGDE